jgi:SET domain-containing protein
MPRLSYVSGGFQLAVRRSRSGLGLFAEEDIPKDACIIEYVGVSLSKAQEAKSRSRYLFEVNGRRTIDGAPRWNTARYINHSCRPNCEPSIHRGRIFIHARRRIKAGEELAYDYGKAYFDELLKGVCRCPKCMPERARKSRSGAPRAVARSKKARTRA